MDKEYQESHLELQLLLKDLSRAKNEWEHAVDCLDSMVMLIDTEGNIKRCNKAARDFIGTPYPEIVGKQWRTLLGEHGIDPGNLNESERGADILLQAAGRWLKINLHYDKTDDTSLSEGTVVTVSDVTESMTLAESLELINTEIDRSRGELQFALDEISFLLREVERDQDLSLRFSIPDSPASGPVYQIAGHFNDMMDKLESQHKELETAYSELKAAQSRLLQQEKMASIGQLSAGIAHEINNPMGFIISNLGTLRKFAGRFLEFIDAQAEALEAIIASPDQKTAIVNVVKERKKALKIDYIMEDTGNLIRESLEGADRVKNIVQELKRFSRIDDSEYMPADINAGIESTIHIVWNELKYKVSLKKEYGNIPITKCNLGQLNQVFMNMLINAANAIEKQGDIIIRTRHEDGHIYISISDTGCGIPEKIISRIFEPFFTTKEVGKGTGLGLSIAYDIVKKHNGEISVQSEVGKGTTFTIKIPVIQ